MTSKEGEILKQLEAQGLKLTKKEIGQRGGKLKPVEASGEGTTFYLLNNE